MKRSLILFMVLGLVAGLLATAEAKKPRKRDNPVLVTVKGIGSDAGPGRAYGTFCGETEEPIAFDRGEGLRFSPGYWDPYLPTPWASCPPGFGTTGTISVTLSNLP